MRLFTLPMIVSAVLALTLAGCGAGAETPAGESSDTSAAAPEDGSGSASADGSATADEALGDAVGPDDEADAGAGGGFSGEWWNADISVDASAPDTLQGTGGDDKGDGDKGDGAKLTMEECIEECIAKGQSEADCDDICEAYLAGSGKDDEGAGEGKDDDGTGTDDGKDDDGTGTDDGKDDTGVPEAVPCPDDFDPSEPCEGSALETACVVDGEWFWCEGGAWTNEK